MQPVSETAPVAGVILAAGKASRFRAGDPSAKSKTVAFSKIWLKNLC
jgi:CTP:molybdopterin cytidylyltransferase MocA